MEVTYIGLSEYYKRFIPKAKEKKYIWVISLIARYSDAEEIFNRIESEWSSINDLTSSKILLIFSSPHVSKKASFLHKIRSESYVGYMCPFIELLNGKDVEDNRGPFKNYYHNYDNIDWKEKHSQAITEFAHDYHISEEKIPCFFFWNLKNDRKKIIALSSNTNVYLMLKDIINKVTVEYERLDKIEKELEMFGNIQRYDLLFANLLDKAKNLDNNQCIAITDFLNEKQNYLDIKHLIKDKHIKNDLKRINQWKRQYHGELEDADKKKAYKNLMDSHQSAVENIDSLLDQVEINDYDIMKNKEQKIDKNTFIKKLVSVCIKLQANATYYKSTENRRNDYVRDLLETSGYDVKDQTRRGLSSKKKAAGEVDILLKEKEMPIAVIEALNLDSLNLNYIDKHLSKIFDYDTAGNDYNIILNYVSVSDFNKFCSGYYNYIKFYKYPFKIIGSEDNVVIGDKSYNEIKIMKTLHIRNGSNTELYHICIHIR